MGKLIRDDDAMQMLRTAIRNLPLDASFIVRNVTDLVLDAIQNGKISTADDLRRLAGEMERVQQKKEAVLDSYFSGEIKKEDMLEMNRRYGSQIEELRQRQKDAEFRQRQNRDSNALRAAIQSEVSDILNGKIESDVFCKTMLESLTVYKDRHMDLRLNFLPQVFRFSG